MTQPTYPEGTVIHNPTTGQEAVMRNGKWTLTGTTAMQAGAPKPDDAALTAMTADQQQKQILAQRAQEFMKLQGGPGKDGVATGPIYGDIPYIDKFIPNIARAVAGVTDTLTGGNTAQKLQDMSSISNQTFPLMRPQGQGRLLEIEGKAFKAAFPNPANWGNSNADITNRLVSEARDAANKLKFVNDYVRANKGSVADAQVAYAQQAQHPTQALAPQAQVAAPAMTIDIHGRPLR